MDLILSKRRKQNWRLARGRWESLSKSEIFFPPLWLHPIKWRDPPRRIKIICTLNPLTRHGIFGQCEKDIKKIQPILNPVLSLFSDHIFLSRVMITPQFNVQWVGYVHRSSWNYNLAPPFFDSTLIKRRLFWLTSAIGSYWLFFLPFISTSRKFFAIYFCLNLIKRKLESEKTGEGETGFWI